MKVRVTPSLFGRVMACLIVSGARHGIPFGMCLGAAVGALFLFVFIAELFSAGFLCISAGAIVAIPLGFVAGVIATALGGRRGWAAAGAISMAGPVLGIGTLMLRELIRHPYHHLSAAEIANAQYCFAAAVGVVAAFGSAAGRWYGKHVPEPLIDVRTGRILTWEAARQARSERASNFIALTDLAAAVRLSAAAAILILVFGVGWDVLHIVPGLAAGH